MLMNVGYVGGVGRVGQTRSQPMGGGVPPLPAGFSFLMLNQAYVTDDAGRFIVVEN